MPILMHDDFDTQTQCEEMEGFLPTEEDYTEFTTDVRNVRHDIRRSLACAVKPQSSQAPASATILHSDS